ncbi:hypothetical protein AVEN_89568-1 [Araneus ventricosus]|uniref:Uncharacterized protein n=1 Tax=Araneus ventricosus TaxID=182803 RepID=A0A4Y2GV06_ARAVE|nr:hypothetical protein AVEN_89568-1 [Araneus ventricosus]
MAASHSLNFHTTTKSVRLTPDGFNPFHSRRYSQSPFKTAKLDSGSCSGKVSASRPEGSRLDTQFHQRSVYVGLVYVRQIRLGDKRSPADVVRNFRRGIQDQVSSSSSDRSSKLRGPP